MKTQKHEPAISKSTIESQYFWDSEINAIEKRHLELEKALKESNERFRAIADYTFDWELWHAPDGRLLWVNKSVERITGYTVDECMKMEKFPLPLVYHEDLPKIEAYYNQSLINPTIETDITFRVRRKNGSLIWVSASWQPIYDEKGNCNGLRTSIRDISKRVQAEELLKRVIEEMRKSNETINKQIYKMNELKFKHDSIERKYKELENKRDRFLSMISQDLVKIFIALQSVNEIIKSCEDDKAKRASEKIDEIKEFIQDCLKEVNTYFINV